MGLGSSVFEGKIRYLSVSQLERFDSRNFGGCERKYYFRYVLRAPEPTKQNQKLGKQCHAQVEHYLKTGEDVLGELTRAGKRFLPKPGPDLMVEYPFGTLRELEPGGLHGPVDSPLLAAGIPLVGVVDLMHGRGEWVDDEGVSQKEASAAEVVDWKTTAQIADEVDASTGAVTKRGYAKTSREIAESWQMAGYAELARLTFPQVTHVRVGHGYFQTRGHRAAVKRSELISVRDVRERWLRADALVERMSAVAAAKSVKDVTPNYEACSAYGGCPHRAACPRDSMVVLQQLFGGKGMSLLEKMKANRALKAVAREGSVETTLGTRVSKTDSTISGIIAAEVEVLKAEELAAITPPDLPAPSAVAEPTLPESTLAMKVKRVKKKEAITTPKYDQIVLNVPLESGVTLYLDSSEDGIPAERLEAVADKLANELAAAHDAADILCAPEGTPLAFGKWKGALAAYAREEVKFGTYVCSSGNEVAMVVFNALAPKAARVVRGHR